MDSHSQPSLGNQGAEAAGTAGPTNGPAQQYLAKKSRIRVSDLKEAKRRGERWSMLTCYDTISARIFDAAKIPCLLVGDSAAQMVYGYKSTIPITMDELIPLARAVASSCERALVVGDMTFGSYQESPEVALRNATRFMKEALVHAVKLEGGAEFARHIKLLTQSGIPVMAHIGFAPQSEHTIGGYRVQGRGPEATKQLLEDALAVQNAGAFACVVEMVPSEVGRVISSELQIPIVGIGAGPHTDAQILVWHDMAGFTAPKSSKGGACQYLSDSVQQNGSGSSGKGGLELAKTPKFVKQYAQMSEVLYQAAVDYANDVSLGLYPAKEHCYE